MVMILLFLVGVVLLVVGADRLVAGASALAERLGLSPLVIGLTVVALGTSSPELFVSVVGSLQGKSNLAIGNVVGSNLGNLLLILGATGLILPMAVTPRIVRLDAPVMVISTILVGVFGFDGTISRVEGFIFLGCAVLYLWYSVYSSKSESITEKTEPTKKRMSGAMASLSVGVGLISLIGGSQCVLHSAVHFAKSLGMSELVIGLTIVAMGTSLPEIATSLIAAKRGESDLSVGNIVGSNILNVFAILGASSVVSGTGLSVPAEANQFDIPLMILVSSACVPLFWTHGKITRLDSFILISGYILYTVYLILGSTGSGSTRILFIPAALYVVVSTVVIFSGVARTLRGNKLLVASSNTQSS
jgi:cation:H+ antiporter